MEQKKGKLVQSRKIELNVFDLGDHKVLVEGKLLDTRTSVNPEETRTGIIHDLIGRIWVQGPNLTISAVEAEMPHIPQQECTEVLPGMQRLVGVKIVTGFTQKVKDLIGDVNGCFHMMNLFMAMGPVAVQGYRAIYGRKPGARSLDNPIYSHLVNSCYFWRKDGPHVSYLASKAKEKKEK